MVCLYCWYDEMVIVRVEGGGGNSMLVAGFRWLSFPMETDRLTMLTLLCKTPVTIVVFDNILLIQLYRRRRAATFRPIFGTH